MKVLILKNVANEGPGTIGDFLEEKNIPYQVLNMYEPGEMPDISEFTHLVIMGGPMPVYAMEKFPFLHIEAAVIRSFIKNGKAVLGVCLGAQLIAYALGADVYSGGKEEMGWYNVELTAEGMKDPVISSIAVNSTPFAEVLQWHGDTFDLPSKAVRMSSSEQYENQAFRFRENVYGLQFHIEVTPAIVREWFADEKGDGIENIFKQSDTICPEYRKRADKFYERFFV